MIPIELTLVGLLAGGAVASIQNGAVILAAAAVLVSLVEAEALRRAAGAFTLAMIPVLIINALGISGFLLYDRLASVASVSARLPTSDHLYATALTVILGFTAAVTVGALVVLLLPKGHAGRLTLRGVVAIRPGLVLFAGFAPLVIYIFGRGSALIEASHYLDATGPITAVSIGGSFAPVGILALALAAYGGGAAARLAWLGLVAWTLVLFCVGTRMLALIPGLMLVGYLLAPSRKRRRVGALRIAVVALATLMLSQLPLILRGTSAGVGFIPFTERLTADPGLAFRLIPDAVAGNLLFGTPLTGFVTEIGRVVAHQFWVSVSPLPSGFTDWAEVSGQLRVNGFTPYNGLGELGAQGPLYVIGYGILFGAVLSLVHRGIVQMLGTLRVVASLFAVALGCLFAVDMLQYNLRSATRIAWYLLAFMVVLEMRKLVMRPRRAELAGPARGQASSLPD